MSSSPTISYFLPEIKALLQELRESELELCYFLSLEKSLKVISCTKISSAHSSEVTITVKTLLKLLKPKVCSIVLLHNHPSQLVYPSKADYDSTYKLVNLGELLNFKVLDHVIVTSEEYFSFAEAGILSDFKNPSS